MYPPVWTLEERSVGRESVHLAILKILPCEEKPTLERDGIGFGRRLFRNSKERIRELTFDAISGDLIYEVQVFAVLCQMKAFSFHLCTADSVQRAFFLNSLTLELLDILLY